MVNKIANIVLRFFSFIVLALILNLQGCMTKSGDVWDEVVGRYVSITSIYDENSKPTNEIADLKEGMDAYKQKEYRKAQILFARFVNKNPTSELVSEGLFLQGECFYYQHIYPQAIRYYQDVIDQYSSSPKYLPSLFKKGCVFLQIGKKDEAKKIFSEIIKKYPNTKYEQNARIALTSGTSNIPEDSKEEALHVNHKQELQPQKRNIFSNTLPSELRKGYAVIVGISAYEEGRKGRPQNLIYADEDAKSFAEMLKKLGWNPNNMKLLLNEQAKRRDILIALDSWLTKAGSNDIIVFFWSGHGYPDPMDPEKVYFACHDTDLNIPATGFRMDYALRSLDEKNAKNVMIFADTCHAGKLITRGNKGISITASIEKLRRGKNIPKGWIFMVGADTDRQAIEHLSWTNGAFTYCLLKALGGEADGFQSAGSKDGIVTMGEVRSYLYSKMPDVTQKVLGVAMQPVIATSSGDPDIWNLSLKVQ